MKRAVGFFITAMVVLNAVLVLIAMQKRKQYLSQPLRAGEINAVGVLGGDRKAVTAQDFRGGYARAMMGGVELDLTAAHIDKPPAVLDTTVFMGGLDIRVPREWRVKNEADIRMGGADIAPSAATDGEVPDLIITGKVRIGGLSVR